MKIKKVIYSLFIFMFILVYISSTKSYSIYNDKKNNDNMLAEFTLDNSKNNISNDNINKTIPKNRIIIKAYEFEIDGNKNIIIAKGGVKIYESNLYIVGNEASYNQNTKVAQIIGNINLNYKNFKVTCQKVTLYGYGDRRIEALNNVNFSYKDINGKSNIAVFYPQESKMILKGGAVANSRRNQLSGEEIIIFVEQNRIISHGNTVVTISKTKK